MIVCLSVFQFIVPSLNQTNIWIILKMVKRNRERNNGHWSSAIEAIIIMAHVWAHRFERNQDFKREWVVHKRDTNPKWKSNKKAYENIQWKWKRMNMDQHGMHSAHTVQTFSTNGLTWVYPITLFYFYHVSLRKNKTFYSFDINSLSLSSWMWMLLCVFKYL